MEMPPLDETSIVLTEDQQAVLDRTIKEIQQNLANLIWLRKDGETLMRGVATSVMNLTESHIKTLGELLGVETEASEKIKKRHGEIRAANLEIHRLNALVGSSQDLAQVQLALKSMAEKLYDWWKLEGFGHTSSISFGEYNAKVEFSCMLFGDFSVIASPTPISDKDRKVLWKQSLADRGFVLFKESGNGTRVKDCEQTRSALNDLFGQRLPGSKITRFISHEGKNGSVLDGIEVVIRSIELIGELPVPPRVIPSE